MNQEHENLDKAELIMLIIIKRAYLNTVCFSVKMKHVLRIFSYHTFIEVFFCTFQSVFGCFLSFYCAGACCPLYAGILRVLYDKEKLDTFARVSKHHFLLLK